MRAPASWSRSAIGLTSVKPGGPRDPAVQPPSDAGGECLFCKTARPTSCVGGARTQGKDVIARWHHRFSYNGQTESTTTWAARLQLMNTRVVPKSPLAKINPDANPEHVCLLVAV